MGTRRQRRAEPTERPAPDAEAAFEIAVHFLGARPRTRWELERRLRRAAVDETVIAATIDRLTGLGYVDDLAFGRWWLEQRDRHAPRGRRLVEAELRQRGVPREVIAELREDELEPEEAVLEGDEVGQPLDDGARARIALRRHLRGRPLPDDARAMQRVGSFLMRRGFDAETVRATLRAAGRDDTDDEVG